MRQPSWTPDATEAPALLVENWLFRLIRAPFRSLASGKRHSYYVVELADAVNVIAVTPGRRVVLVRQFRAGSGHDSLEPPGGLVDRGEDPLEAAARELREETGYEGDPPRLLGVSWSNPSILSSKIYTVLITDAKPTAEASLDAEEEVTVETVPAGQVPWMIRDGRIDHALAVQGLMLWLASELPESPFAPPPLDNRLRQFSIGSLMAAVAAFSLVFSLFVYLGTGAFALILALSIGFGPLLVLRLLDPPSSAILLRGRRSTVRYQLMRLLAVMGIVVILAFVGFLILQVIARLL